MIKLAIDLQKPADIASQGSGHLCSLAFTLFFSCALARHPPQELWTEVESEQDLQAVLSSLPPNKMLVVDYYASKFVTGQDHDRQPQATLAALVP